MALRHCPFVIGAPGAQPSANFLAGQVAAGFLVGHPRRQGFLLEALTGFLVLDVLLDRFEHDPVGRATALAGEALDAAFQRIVDLERSLPSWAFYRLMILGDTLVFPARTVKQ